MVIPYAPSPIRTRSYHFVKTLARRGHAVTLAAPWEDAEDLEGLRRLEREGVAVLTAPLPRLRSARNLLRAAFGDMPLQGAYSWSPELYSRIERHLKEAPAPDAIHVEHLRGARYGLALASPRAAEGRPGVVWDSVDCISLLFERTARFNPSLLRRTIARFELPRTRRWEGRLVRRFGRVLATSTEDATALEGLARHNGSAGPSVTVIENGVDLAYYAPVDDGREPDQILLTGKMSYHANVAAAVHLVRDIMPLVWSTRPSVRVVLAGKSPVRAVRDLEQIRPGFVSVTGTVSDLRPHLRRAAAAVAPMVYGVGIQNKVLEAMACATPVIASPQATAALSATPGEELLVGDSPQEMSQAILRVLADEPLRRRLGAKGRAYVERRHDWAAIVGNLEQVYAAAPAGPG